MLQTEKINENRLRLMAKRRGLKLVKSPRRDHKAIDYGTWTIVDADGFVVAGVPTMKKPRLSDEKYRLYTLEEVEEALR